MSGKKRLSKKFTPDKSQMSIRSAIFNMSAKKEKKELFRFPKQVITPLVIEIDSDSDLDDENLIIEKRVMPLPPLSDEEIEESLVTLRTSTSVVQIQKDADGEVPSTSKASDTDILDYDSDATLIYEPEPLKPEIEPEKASNKRPLTEANFFSTLKKTKNIPATLEKENTPTPPNSQSQKSLTSINTLPLNLFLQVLKNVKDGNYKHLVPEEAQVIDNYLKLKFQHKYLLFKMFTRRDKWHFLFEFVENVKLSLKDEEVISMYEELVKMNFLDNDTSKDDPRTLLSNLNVKKVRSIYNTFRLSNDKNKPKMIDKILENCKQQSTLPFGKTTYYLLIERIKSHMKYYVKLSSQLYEAFERFYILDTFVNRDFEKISDFFHSMLMLRVEFADFNVDECDVFGSRDNFLRFVAAKSCRLDMMQAEDSKDLNRLYEIGKTAFVRLQEIHQDLGETVVSDNPHVRHFTAESIYIGVLNICCKKLSTKFPEMVKIWLHYLIDNHKGGNKLGGWYLQLSWIYTQYLKPPNHEKSAELIIKALDEKRGELTEVQIQDIAVKANKFLNSRTIVLNGELKEKLSSLMPPKFCRFPSISIEAHCEKSHTPGERRQYYILDKDNFPQFLGVEDIAKQHYIDVKGYESGIHCEGNLIHASFVLLFWDLIYEFYVPGTFVSPYQCAPLDFCTKHFYLNRQTYIDQRLNDLENNWSDEHVIQILEESWYDHGTKYSICNISGNISEPELFRIIVLCMGRAIMAKIYRRLVQNYRLYRSGLPDLFVWNKSWKSCKFVEVKGEGDVLQTNQKIWISYLMSIGADVEVCHVHPFGSKKRKSNHE